MIALCHEHHDLADAGRYTKDQLRELKKNPYIKSAKVSEEYGYLRRNTIYCAGDSIGYDVSYVLTIDEEPVIWFERDEDGYERLNLLIKDSQGNTILYMKNNDWIVFTNEIFDFECPAKGQTLKVISKDKKTNFELRFDDLRIEKFEEKLLGLGYDAESIAQILPKINPDIPGQIPTWTIKGNLTYENVKLYIDDSGITNVVNQSSFSRIVMIHSEVFLNFDGNGNFFMGGPHISQHSVRKKLELEIKEIERLNNSTQIYRKRGQIYFITDRDQLIEELRGKINMLGRDSHGDA